MPRVSVVMGVYNGAAYVEKSIKSILTQSFTDFELIICDDASTDNSVDIINKLMETDNRIILIRNKKNMGLAYSLNKCIDISKSEYIARMDDDDIALENRFEIQVNFLDKNSEFDLVCSGVNMFDENGIWGKRIDNRPLNKKNIYKYNIITHPTVIMRKNALMKVGRYTVSNETLRCEDYDLWCKFYAKGFKAYYIKDILLNYRENQYSFNKRTYKTRINAMKVKLKCRKLLNLPFIYNVYAFRGLIVGLIPNFIIKKIHRYRFDKLN